jgi:hypothetical protein
MADVDFDDFGSGYAGPADGRGRLQRMVNLAGAVSSVALIVAAAVWGYKLAVRDVSGIPVVRALEGPMRTAPDNPGGDIVDHQGLSVNDVAEVGTATPLPERLVLAPRPVELTVEDAPGLAPIALDEPAPTLVAMREAQDLALGETNAVQSAVEMALTDALTDAGVDAAPLAEGALARSLRPQPRPGSEPLQLAAADPLPDAPAAPQPAAQPAVQPAVQSGVAFDPAALAVGTPLVQFGAFETVADAEAEWAELQARFGDLMATKAMVVQPASSAGQQFFRLRGHGFESEDDARRFCAALLAENAACIPVSHR